MKVEWFIWKVDCQWKYKIRIDSQTNYLENLDDLKISINLQSTNNNPRECDINIKAELTIDESVFSLNC